MLTAGQKLRVLIPLAAVNTAGYLLLNQHPLRPPSPLPLSFADRVIPFLPWTVWPYALLLLSDVALPLLLRTRRVFRDMLVAYGAAIPLNFLGWACFPTTYPRPAAPAASSLTGAAYALLVAVDTPACCFPSGHITIPALACWGVGREQPGLRPYLYGAFALLALSVLTTKQHYVVDVLGGLGTALAGVALARWRAGKASPGGIR
jgi:hypothetical protein